MLFAFDCFIVEQLKSNFYYNRIFLFITECDDGAFGQDCKGECHCLNQVACSKGNGACLSGVCANGWRGITCSTGTVYVDIRSYCTRGYPEVMSICLLCVSLCWNDYENYIKGNVIQF